MNIFVFDYGLFVKKNSNVEKVLKNFKKLNFNIYYVDLSKIIFKRKKINFNKKFYYPKNLKELEDFILSKNKGFLINFSDMSFKFYKIHFLIKKLKLKQIIISDLGYDADNKIVNKNISRNIINIIFKHYLFYFLFRLLILFNIFSQIEILFESSKINIKRIKLGYSYKINKLFPLIKLNFYKKIVRINSQHFDDLKKDNRFCEKKYITFLETPLNHPDRILRDGPMTEANKEKYYTRLNHFFGTIKIIFNKKIIICLHPRSNIEFYRKKFKHKVVKGKSDYYIKKSDIVIFHNSSSVMKAIVLKKKILSLQSKIMGPFWNYRNNVYLKYIPFPIINLDNKIISINKKKLLSHFNKILKRYDQYIKDNMAINAKLNRFEQIKKILSANYFFEN